MTPRDRRRLSAVAAQLARDEADARARWRDQADPLADELAEYARRRRLSIEAELQADADRAARSCAGESLPLFEEC